MEEKQKSKKKNKKEKKKKTTGILADGGSKLRLKDPKEKHAVQHAPVVAVRAVVVRARDFFLKKVAFFGHLFEKFSLRGRF